MIRGMLGSVKSENPKGKGKLGNGKLKNKIINYENYSMPPSMPLSMLSKHFRPHISMFSSSLSDLMKSIEVDESLSTTSTDVLFQKIPTNFKITNDILWRMENQEVTVMFMLGLSTAFDTVDHSILLKILKKSFGFCDEALKCFDMYLQPRWFKVCIYGNYSKPMELWFSIPQGSCGGANLFCCYCSLISSCIPPQLTINGFADDHSIRQQHKRKVKSAHR